MEKIQVDEGKSFDFGKTSADYAKFRDIYPKELYDKLYSLGIGNRKMMKKHFAMPSELLPIIPVAMLWIIGFAFVRLPLCRL